MKITVEKLTEWEACEEQIDLFAKTFPDGAEITLENLMTAARAGLDINWLANRPFYRPALKAYKEAKAPALKAYVEAKVSGWKAYMEVKAPARKAYEEAKAPAFWKCGVAAGVFTEGSK